MPYFKFVGWNRVKVMLVGAKSKPHEKKKKVKDRFGVCQISGCVTDDN